MREELVIRINEKLTFVLQHPVDFNENLNSVAI